tara:strand:+ start:559 stop:885 length:327 start_codon:yes stop_codon:yes gene_type:complete
MRKIISVLLLSVMFSASVTAEYTVYGGGGSKSCGFWIAEEEKSSGFYYAMSDWVAGYVTGVASIGVIVLKKSDNPSRDLFVTNYCNANPLDKVVDAAGALVMALRVQE